MYYIKRCGIMCLSCSSVNRVILDVLYFRHSLGVTSSMLEWGIMEVLYWSQSVVCVSALSVYMFVCLSMFEFFLCFYLFVCLSQFLCFPVFLSLSCSIFISHTHTIRLRAACYISLFLSFSPTLRPSSSPPSHSLPHHTTLLTRTPFPPYHHCHPLICIHQNYVYY